MLISSTKGIGVDALKILVYGESGAGKTSLAKTIGEPTIVISAEAGLLPLRGESIDVIDITTDDKGQPLAKDKRIDRLAEAYQYLLTPEAQKKYKWIVVDSLSELSHNLIEKLQVEYPDAKNTLQMYGENSKRMRSLVKLFRDLPHYNVMFTALSEVEKDENGQRFMNIQMVGKIAQQLPAYFDEVFFIHTNTDDKKPILVTGKTDRLMSKDRSGALDATEPPNIGLIAKKIRSTNKATASVVETKKEENK